MHRTLPIPRRPPDASNSKKTSERQRRDRGDQHSESFGYGRERNTRTGRSGRGESKAEGCNSRSVVLPLPLPPRPVDAPSSDTRKHKRQRLAGRLLQADGRIRTGDPFITSEVLYQLSYVGRGRDSSGGVWASQCLRAEQSPHSPVTTTPAAVGSKPASRAATSSGSGSTQASRSSTRPQARQAMWWCGSVRAS